MKICAKCGVELTCMKTGCGADFGHGHIYVGDRHDCPICKASVVFCTADAVSAHDPQYRRVGEYVIMTEATSDRPYPKPKFGRVIDREDHPDHVPEHPPRPDCFESWDPDANKCQTCHHEEACYTASPARYPEGSHPNNVLELVNWRLRPKPRPRATS